MIGAVLGFAACWLLATVLMWRILGAGVTTDSPVLRAAFALAWPVFLWREGR